MSVFKLNKGEWTLGIIILIYVLFKNFFKNGVYTVPVLLATILGGLILYYVICVVFNLIGLLFKKKEKK